MIKTDKLEKWYGETKVRVHALRGVSLSIVKAEFIAVMGPSGSGKSTLLHMVGALDRSSAGEVWIGGRALSGLSDNELTLLRRSQIGFVFQFFNLLPTLTARENVLLPALLDGVATKEAERRADALLDRVGLSGRGRHRPDELSGGEMQRVAIARALVKEAPLLLADEPTGNLDTTTGRGIFDLLRELKASAGLTIVMVTHDPNAAHHADRVIHLRDGLVENDVRNHKSAGTDAAATGSPVAAG
ncbi:MAG: ABC transporter ATP-binding protein [Deltaproteobacteria bacterium]|nr:ABC transporter ATP-binding protein [Deltaproteobacteria bacterium]